jgi:hypothetical protein
MLIGEQRVRASPFLSNELKTAKARYNSPREKHYYACLTLVAIASVVGTDIRTLAERTGFREGFVSRVSVRMRRGFLWKGDQSELDEWAKWGFLETALNHVCVASGTTGCEIDSDGSVGYFDLILDAQEGSHRAGPGSCDYL